MRENVSSGRRRPKTRADVQRLRFELLFAKQGDRMHGLGQRHLFERDIGDELEWRAERECQPPRLTLE